MSKKIYYDDFNWYIKLRKKNSVYNESKYVEVNISSDKITSIESVFDLIDIPQDYEIADRENLYTINDLPCEYWNKTENPCCFESESGWEQDTVIEQSYNYFDSIIKTF